MTNSIPPPGAADKVAKAGKESLSQLWNQVIVEGFIMTAISVYETEATQLMPALMAYKRQLQARLEKINTAIGKVKTGSSDKAKQQKASQQLKELQGEQSQVNNQMSINTTEMQSIMENTTTTLQVANKIVQSLGQTMNAIGQGM